jgi:hypothetical protein
MTQREVEQILGGPADDYDRGRRILVLELNSGGLSMTTDRIEEWGGIDGFIQLGFDRDDLVAWKRFVPIGPDPVGVECWKFE